MMKKSFVYSFNFKQTSYLIIHLQDAFSLLISCLVLDGSKLKLRIYPTFAHLTVH